MCTSIELIVPYNLSRILIRFEENIFDFATHMWSLTLDDWTSLQIKSSILEEKSKLWNDICLV